LVNCPIGSCSLIIDFNDVNDVYGVIVDFNDVNDVNEVVADVVDVVVDHLLRSNRRCDETLSKKGCLRTEDSVMRSESKKIGKTILQTLQNLLHNNLVLIHDKIK
jgi:hypothetical protein